MKSKKRTTIRRERRAIYEDASIRVDVVRGSDGTLSESHMRAIFVLYRATIEKMYFGRQYLTESLFLSLFHTPSFRKHIVLILAYLPTDPSTPIAGTFNVVAGGVYYGRYWGCTQEVRHLHFETCYYRAIQLVIDEGLERMEPGAGGGEFKSVRGFEAAVTRSAHFMRHPGLHDAVARFVVAEGEGVEDYVEAMVESSVLRRPMAKEDGERPMEQVEESAV